MDNAVRYKQYMIQNSKQEQHKETNQLWYQIKRDIKIYDSVMNNIVRILVSVQQSRKPQPMHVLQS